MTKFIAQAKNYRSCTVNDWKKVILSDETFIVQGYKSSVVRRSGLRYNNSAPIAIMPLSRMENTTFAMPSIIDSHDMGLRTVYSTDAQKKTPIQRLQQQYM
ncbi:hypothetical protein TNCV_786931 [Trichonephila clavipes]|nr:hypothetical protein TNCV_786931 [Trichonephila clavipes]